LQIEAEARSGQEPTLDPESALRSFLARVLESFHDHWRAAAICGGAKSAGDPTVAASFVGRLDQLRAEIGIWTPGLDACDGLRGSGTAAAAFARNGSSSSGSAVEFR
jgi:hypothetical protein